MWVIGPLYWASCGLENIYGGGPDVIPAMACDLLAGFSPFGLSRRVGCA